MNNPFLIFIAHAQTAHAQTTGLPQPPSPNQIFNQLGPAVNSATNAFSQNVQNSFFLHFTIIQILSALVSAALFTMSIYLLVQTGIVRNRIDKINDIILKKEPHKERVRSSWDDIERHFFAGDDNDLKIALIEADNLLDETLHDAGVVGTSLAERLQRVSVERLPNVEDVWQAHKIRNRIAHEAGFVMKRDLAERALTIYEKALEHLGALEPEAKPSNGENKNSDTES